MVNEYVEEKNVAKGAVSEKNFLTTLIICIFLGVLGIHRFYIGKVGSGIAMLLFSLSGLGLIVSLVWWLVDIIVLATGTMKDKYGGFIKG